MCINCNVDNFLEWTRTFQIFFFTLNTKIDHGDGWIRSLVLMPWQFKVLLRSSTEFLPFHFHWLPNMNYHNKLLNVFGRKKYVFPHRTHFTPGVRFTINNHSRAVTRTDGRDDDPLLCPRRSLLFQLWQPTQISVTTVINISHTELERVWNPPSKALYLIY